MSTPAQEPIDTSDFTPEERAELAAIEAGTENTGTYSPTRVKPPKEPHEHSTPVLIGCMVACLAIGGLVGGTIFKHVGETKGLDKGACERAFDHADEGFQLAAQGFYAVAEFAQTSADDPYSLGSAANTLSGKLDTMSAQMKTTKSDYQSNREDCLGD